MPHANTRQTCGQSPMRPTRLSCPTAARYNPRPGGCPMAIATQPLIVTPAHPLFAAEVSGVDLTRRLADAPFERIAQAFDEYSVLVFHGQALTDEQQMAFSERF